MNGIGAMRARYIREGLYTTQLAAEVDNREPTRLSVVIRRKRGHWPAELQATARALAR